MVEETRKVSPETVGAAGAAKGTAGTTEASAISWSMCVRSLITASLGRSGTCRLSRLLRGRGGALRYALQSQLLDLLLE